ETSGLVLCCQFDVVQEHPAWGSPLVLAAQPGFCGVPSGEIPLGQDKERGRGDGGRGCRPPGDRPRWEWLLGPGVPRRWPTTLFHNARPLPFCEHLSRHCGGYRRQGPALLRHCVWTLRLRYRGGLEGESEE